MSAWAFVPLVAVVAWVALGVAAPFIVERYDKHASSRTWAEARRAIANDAVFGEPLLRLIAWPMVAALGPLALALFLWDKAQGRA